MPGNELSDQIYLVLWIYAGTRVLLMFFIVGFIYLFILGGLVVCSDCMPISPNFVLPFLSPPPRYPFLLLPGKCRWKHSSLYSISLIMMGILSHYISAIILQEQDGYTWKYPFYFDLFSVVSPPPSPFLPSCGRFYLKDQLERSMHAFSKCHCSIQSWSNILLVLIMTPLFTSASFVRVSLGVLIT